ncbi:hypothetical protein HOC01_04090 [archaeon]|jgi:phosphohistidine swiveling domain-containing protein|nr:hypothetical protein [archaeon]MBT6698407.1 hypothetical protein [archaeon]
MDTKSDLTKKILSQKFVLNYDRQMTFQKVRLFDYAIQFNIPELLDFDLGPQVYRVKNKVITHWVNAKKQSRLNKKIIEFLTDPKNKDKINGFGTYIKNSLAKLKKFSTSIPDYSKSSDESLLSEYKKFCQLERDISFMNYLLFIQFENALITSLQILLGSKQKELIKKLSLQTKVIPLEMYHLDVCRYLQKEISKKELQEKHLYFGMFDVTDKSLTLKQLDQDCKEIKQEGYEKVKQEIETKYQENKSKVNNTLSQFDINSHLAVLINYYRTYANNKEWKNDIRGMSSYKLAKLLSQIAKNNDLTLEEISYFTEDEICQIITNKTKQTSEQSSDGLEMQGISKNQKIRNKNSLFLIYKKQIQIIEDTKLLRAIDNHLLNSISELKGVVATKGKAKAKVCIILSNKDFDKFEEGDVIVAPTTRPDYLPLMKKSAAIITNEGGVLSHAAILSRELKIPCIIGTKTATLTLKDGDLVEVDANNGIIKILT